MTTKWTRLFRPFLNQHVADWAACNDDAQKTAFLARVATQLKADAKAQGFSSELPAEGLELARIFDF